MLEHLLKSATVVKLSTRGLLSLGTAVILLDSGSKSVALPEVEVTHSFVYIDSIHIFAFQNHVKDEASETDGDLKAQHGK